MPGLNSLTKKVEQLEKLIPILREELRMKVNSIPSSELALNQKLKDFEEKFNQAIKEQPRPKDFSEKVGELEKDIQSLRDLISGRYHGGGNANRNITVAGNSSTLSWYTDINLNPSSSIGWTTSVDHTKRWTNISASVLLAGAGGSGSQDFLTVREVDGSPIVGSVITIRVSNGSLTDDGGGQVTITTSGGVSGINRSASVLSVSSTLAATASTDYVFFPNVGIQLTLPTAIGNSNLYTIKNMAASSILVVAPAGQDIDGSASALMPTQYESLSFMSNNSVWGVI